MTLANLADRPAAVPCSPAARIWRSLLPSWPLIAELVVFGWLAAERTTLLHDPDTYLHIAAGNAILGQRALLLHDPFSFSMPGARWVSSEWLAQIAFAACYDALGWGGVVALTAASAGIAIGLLLHFLLRWCEPLPALVMALAAAALLEAHYLARPHMLALPLLVLWSGMLLAARDSGRGPPFRLLPVMALWTNLHGSFLFGLAFAGFAAGEAILRPAPGISRRAEALRWAGFLVIAFAAALVTPHGLAGLVQPLRLTMMPALQASFSEWLSPNFRASPGLEMWMLGLLLIGFATGLRLPLSRTALLLGLVHMTLQHARHADLLAVVAPLAVAAPLGRFLAGLGEGQPVSPLVGWAQSLPRVAGLPSVAVTAALAVALATPLAVAPIVRGDDQATPATALAAAQRLGLSGPVFNSEGFGGYLIFRGIPTFIDGRIEMYGNDFLATDVEAERGDRAALTAILARYRIGWSLLQPGFGAVAVMDNLPGWQRVYADQYAVVHRRVEPTGR